jgi:hypothetical protein
MRIFPIGPSWRNSNVRIPTWSRRKAPAWSTGICSAILPDAWTPLGMHPPESSQGLWLLDGLPGHQLPLFVEYVDSHGERRRKTPALLTLPEFDSVIELAADKVTRATRVVEDWLEKRKALLPYWEGYPARTLAEAYEAKAKAESEA